jgi:hypothetical protein
MIGAIRTGRYATFQPEHGTPIAITVGRPKFPISYEPIPMPELAPWGLGGLEPDEFDQGYRERLDRLGVDRIRDRFEQSTAEHGGPLVLLCFEPVGQPCHRRVAAAWLEAHGFGPVPEVEPVTNQLTMQMEA